MPRSGELSELAARKRELLDLCEGDRQSFRAPLRQAREMAGWMDKGLETARAARELFQSLRKEGPADPASGEGEPKAQSKLARWWGIAQALWRIKGAFKL